MPLVLKQCGSSFTHSEMREWEAPECWEHVTLLWGGLSLYGMVHEALNPLALGEEAYG